MDIERIELIQNVNVLVFGDFMVDKYILGDVKRISPEAPVPILEISAKQSKLGGAGNVVNNIVALGAKARVLGCVGNDIEGLWMYNELQNLGVDVSFLSLDPSVKTICKTRLASRNQQFLRFDEEKIDELPKDYQLFVQNNISEIINSMDIIIISDYGKGAITNKIAQLIIKIANESSIPTIIDPKGKDYSKYKGATVCTPNTKELNVCMNADISNNDEESINYFGNKLLKEIDLKYLLLTRSEKGISLFEKGIPGKIDYPTVKKDIIDVTGAGDTVVTAISLFLASGFSISESCKLANIAASVVCSKFGAATLSLNELLKCMVDIRKLKLIDPTTAKYIVAQFKEEGKKVVFTNGCFDLLHAGHLSSFMQAKSFGDILVVAVNSDASVKKIKGDLRPIISENYRISMLCAIEYIDYVILMDDDTPINIIKEIKPDITVKGKDWEDKLLPEKEIVESYGGQVKYIEMLGSLSTSVIINKIVAAYGAHNERS